MGAGIVQVAAQNGLKVSEFLSPLLLYLAPADPAFTFPSARAPQS